jgi:hypothetical protein
LEEYAPKIVYTQLEYNPTLNLTKEYTHTTVGIPMGKLSTYPIKWMAFSNHWQCYNKCHATMNTNVIQLDAVFANLSEVMIFTI